MTLRTAAAGVFAASLFSPVVHAGPAAAAQPEDAALYEETPASQDLGVDPDSPANCAQRNGAVFFGPVGTGRGCVVPEGRPIVMVYLGWSCSTAEGNGRTFHELRRCAERSWRDELGDVRIRQTVDGSLVHRPRRWTVSTPDMWVDLPRNNVWGVRPGWTRSVGRAIVHVLRPPRAGDHVVRVRMIEDGKRTVLKYAFTVQ
jgi:hypothetical protein